MTNKVNAFVRKMGLVFQNYRKTILDAFSRFKTFVEEKNIKELSDSEIEQCVITSG
jgi:hypothetical protein